MSPLAWSPVYRILEEQILTGDDLILVIAPFIKVDALRRLHEAHKKQVQFRVICRWHAEDIVSGASDVEVYSYLKEIGSHLYLNPDIHLKLYIFNSNVVFSTSGNLTLRGLGYSEQANIEVGNVISLTEYDWAKIYRIIDTSHLIDDTLYNRYKAFLDQQPKPHPPTYPPELFPIHKKYTISSLPATDNPIKLTDYYFNPILGNYPKEEIRRALHDIVTFEIPQGLSEADFERYLNKNFCNSAFVRDFVELLKLERSLRFGAVNDWIYQKCEDVPLPYRWEIKSNTRIFYEWLAHFIPEVTWDRPAYSQVIYWKRT